MALSMGANGITAGGDVVSRRTSDSSVWRWGHT